MGAILTSTSAVGNLVELETAKLVRLTYFESQAGPAGPVVHDSVRCLVELEQQEL